MSDELPHFARTLRRQLVRAAAEQPQRRFDRLRFGVGRGVLVAAVALILAAAIGIPLAQLSGLRGGGSEAGVSSVVPGASETVFPVATFNLKTSTFSVEPGISGVAAGFGSVWVVGQQSIFRLDAGNGDVLATIPFDGGDYGSVTLGEKSVWATNGGPDVTEVDPQTNKVLTTVTVGGHVHSLVADSGALWVSTSEKGGELVQVDPDSGSVTGTVAAPVGWLQYVDGTVWVLGGETATEVDAQSLSASTVQLPVSGPSVVDAGYIWSVSQNTADADESEVAKVSVDTGEVVSKVTVPRAAAIAADSTGVWVLSATGSKSDDIYLPDPKKPALVTLIDPTSGVQAADPVPVDITPASIGVGEGDLWVSHYEAGMVTRIEPTAA